MYVYTCITFVAVLSPTIKIFPRHLGPNLYIFAVKFSPWFHWHFTVILWHITAKKHRPRWFLAKTCCACCTWWFLAISPSSGAWLAFETFRPHFGSAIVRFVHKPFRS